MCQNVSLSEKLTHCSTKRKSKKMKKKQKEERKRLGGELTFINVINIKKQGKYENIYRFCLEIVNYYLPL
jgi:hypothetical protein